MFRGLGTCARQTPQNPSHRSCFCKPLQQSFDARHLTRVTNTKGRAGQAGTPFTQRCLGTYFAFWSACITPKRFPSVSVRYAKYPTVGITVLGMTSFPPAFFTVSTAVSTESTLIVLVVVLTSVFFMRPPLIPGVPSAPVVTIQYSMGPGHFSIFQPNTFL